MARDSTRHIEPLLQTPVGGAQPPPLAPQVAPAKASSAATWDWLLCDGYGAPLAELTTASGKQVTYKRNNYAEAQLVLSHQDDAATYFMKALNHGPMPTLRAYRKGANDAHGILRFNGYLAPFSETLEETTLMSLVFRSPFARLFGDGWSGSGRYTGPVTTNLSPPPSPTGDAIAVALVNLYGGAGTIGGTDPTLLNWDGGALTYTETSFAGLGVGSIAATATRDLTYNYANVGQSILFLSQMLDGFDFDETFVEGSTIQGFPVMANFNTYAALGQTRPGAHFEYGPNTLGNVRHVERTTAAPMNSVRLIGSGGLVSFTESAASIAAYGRWVSQQQVTGTPDQPALDARALALLRAKPVKTLKFDPDIALDSCPKPWDDFFMGDTVSFYGNRGAFQESLTARVNELMIVVDENGYETASIPDPHTLSAEDRENRTDLLHTSFTVETTNAF